MALPAHAQVSLAELKRFMVLGGPLGTSAHESDDRLEDCIGRASLDIEGEGLGFRRGVYRGPVESYVGIVSNQTITDGSLTIAGPPSSDGRTLVVRKRDADRSMTAGTLTVSQASPALSETFDLSLGNELHGVKFFTSTVTAILSGVVGATSADKLDIGTSAGYTEFFSPTGWSCDLRPLEWPIRYVIDLREDYNRVFGSDTVLIEGTDFELRNHDSISRSLTRLSGGLDAAWRNGRRSVRARMSAGWNGIAGVPGHVKNVCLELAAWHFQHADRKEYGLVNRTDGLSTITRSGPPMLTAGFKSRLGSEWRAEQMPTAERGWVEA